MIKRLCLTCVAAVMMCTMCGCLSGYERKQAEGYEDIARKSMSDMLGTAYEIQDVNCRYRLDGFNRIAINVVDADITDSNGNTYDAIYDTEKEKLYTTIGVEDEKNRIVGALDIKDSAIEVGIRYNNGDYKIEDYLEYNGDIGDYYIYVECDEYNKEEVNNKLKELGIKYIVVIAKSNGAISEPDIFDIEDFEKYICTSDYTLEILSNIAENKSIEIKTEEFSWGKIQYNSNECKINIEESSTKLGDKHYDKSKNYKIKVSLLGDKDETKIKVYSTEFDSMEYTVTDTLETNDITLNRTYDLGSLLGIYSLRYESLDIVDGEEIVFVMYNKEDL